MEKNNAQFVSPGCLYANVEKKYTHVSVNNQGSYCNTVSCEMHLSCSARLQGEGDEGREEGADAVPGTLEPLSFVYPVNLTDGDLKRRCLNHGKAVSPLLRWMRMAAATAMMLVLVCSRGEVPVKQADPLLASHRRAFRSPPSHHGPNRPAYKREVLTSSHLCIS